MDCDQPTQDLMPSHVSRVIRSCNGIGRGENCLEGLDDATQEEFENLSPNQTIREHSNSIIKLYFEQKSVITQAQILHRLIKHKKL